MPDNIECKNQKVPEEADQVKVVSQEDTPFVIERISLSPGERRSIPSGAGELEIPLQSKTCRSRQSGSRVDGS